MVKLPFMQLGAKSTVLLEFIKDKRTPNEEPLGSSVIAHRRSKDVAGLNGIAKHIR